ncbi:hypothetical protein DINM_020478 [Dirofilaria immitis]|nr:hypothetical protein [Dirofilaria immitis]
MQRGSVNCAQRYDYPYTEKMYLSLWIFFLLVLNKSATCYAAKRNSERNERAVGHSEEYIKQIFYAHANCIDTDWACNQECRLEYVNRTTGLCIKPSPAETCFGIPIRYNFTFESANVIAALPKYEILSKFPRYGCNNFRSTNAPVCWSALGPLLCAVAYRPCSNRAYFEVSMDKNGLWPGFINCSDTIKWKNGRRIFSDGSCEMAYNKEPSKMEIKQCLWPLAAGTSHSKPMAQSLIDDCYLPCRYTDVNFSFSLLAVLCGLLCTFYLFIFSLLFTSDFCVYSLTHALLNASAHWFIWLVSYADRVTERAMCFDMLRRDTKILRQNIKAARTFSISAIQIGRPKFSSNQMIKWNKQSQLNLRCFFLICYLLACSVAAIELWTDAIETDGITGICYFRFRTVKSAAQLYGPLVIAFVLEHNDRDLKEFGEKDQIALVIDHVDDDDKELFDHNAIKKSGYSQMTFFGGYRFIVRRSCNSSSEHFFATAYSESKIILDSVRCSLNKTIMEGKTGWLHGMTHDQKRMFFRGEHPLVADIVDLKMRKDYLTFSCSFLSAPGCELPSTTDDQPDDTIITSTYNSSSKMNQPEGVSFKRCENNKQSKSDEEESLDTFPADLKIRRLDVLQRSRERRRQQMENGYLFLKPTDSAHLTTKVLSAYQNGLIEGHWRERCVNYEKQIKALSANLRVADHEIRRLAGLEMSESMIKSRKQKFPHATYPIGMNYLPAANASSDRSFSICSEQFKSCQNSKNARILIIDNANYASNSSTENVNLSERPTNAQNIHMPSESRIDEGNETFMCEVSALKSRTIFGTSVIQNPSNEIKDDGKDDGQISGSYHDSDSFNSDEEDSEEERLYNEKVAELQRRH